MRYQPPKNPRPTKHIPSLDSGIGNANKRPDPQYTGTKVLGIALQHKSCYQPVFNHQAAIDSAQMRR